LYASIILVCAATRLPVSRVGLETNLSLLIFPLATAILVDFAKFNKDSYIGSHLEN
jgi:FAD/FMN-containing dehydrogenase